MHFCAMSCHALDHPLDRTPFDSNCLSPTSQPLSIPPNIFFTTALSSCRKEARVRYSQSMPCFKSMITAISLTEIPQPAPMHPPSPIPKPPAIHHLNLGSKTPYPVPIPLSPLSHNSLAPNEPRLIHVSLIARHGTRNPTNNCLLRMSALEAWLTDSLVPQPPWLQQWSTNLQVYRRDPGCLTIQGHQELHGIGFRFAQLYAQSLQNVGNTVRLRSSYKTRAISSARSFLEGYLHACSTQTLPLPNTVLDNEQASDTSESNPSESESSESEPTESDHSETDLTEISSTTPSNDSETLSAFSVDEDDPVEILPFGRDAILRYFEQNHEYATFAVQHKALTQKDLSRGPLRVHAVEMASRMSAGLGASSSMDVDFVRAVAEACAFDCAHGRAETSMFCRVLTPQDTAVLELFEKHHRPYFKGHERFRTVAAPLIEDLVSSLKSSAYGSDDVQPQAADLRFAHAETLVPLLLLLGIRTNGLNPDHPDFLQGLCAMSPFAANFALELYEQNCATGKRHFVRFRLHERYVECIPALGEHGVSGVVELEHLLAFFEGILAEGLHQ